MKRLGLMLTFTLIAVFGFAQDFDVTSGYIGNTNTFVASMNYSGPDANNQDLYFAISADGRPQYGRQVQYNLRQGTNDNALYYRVGKDDIDGDIDEFQEHVSYSGAEVNPPSDTRDVTFGARPIKIGLSWNFSPGSWAIAIISFTNFGEDVISSGLINFDHPNASLPMQGIDYKLYNDWVTHPDIDESGDRTHYKFNYYDLQPSEIRHIYIYLELPKIERMQLDKRYVLNASMDQTSADEMSFDVINPPHDPNSLTLLNAQTNQDEHICEVYNEHEVLKDACFSGIPFWVAPFPSELVDKKCKGSIDPFCWLAGYSFDYPYCPNGKEVLKYKIDCLNDGSGPAYAVHAMVNYWSPVTDPHVRRSFQETDWSHNHLSEWNYPQASFKFESIKLPGLHDEHHVYFYNECMAYVDFELTKKCDLEEEIISIGHIQFLDEQGYIQDELETKKVRLIYDDLGYSVPDRNCRFCLRPSLGLKLGNEGVNALNQYQVGSQLIVTGLSEWGDSYKLNVFDVTGHEYEFTSTDHTIDQLQLDISHLSTGVYILNVRDGERNESIKFFVP